MAKLLNQISNLPKIQDAISSWMDKLTIGYVTQTWSDGDNTETIIQRTANGTIQPLGSKQIALKPEGERAWQYYQIHWTNTSLIFDINNKIYVDGVRYKVMAVNDYSRNGYMEYHIVKDYE